MRMIGTVHRGLMCLNISSVLHRGDSGFLRRLEAEREAPATTQIEVATDWLSVPSVVLRCQPVRSHSGGRGAGGQRSISTVR